MLFGRPFNTIADQICSAGVRYYSFFSFRVRRNVHCVTKNVPPLTCYSLDVRVTTALVFGQSVTEKVRSRTMLCFPTSPHLSSASALPCERRNPEDSALSWRFVRATQTNCCIALDFLSPEPFPQTPKLNALITSFRESYSGVSVCLKSKSLKKSSSDWLNSGNALTQRVKMQFSCFPICQVVQKHTLFHMAW